MKKLKHKKYRNTGLIFEILTRMVIKETMDPNTPQRAIKILKTSFGPNTELVKELKLYHSLTTKTEHDSNELLNLVLESCEKLNKVKLETEKYNLVKCIKKYYNIDVFFNTRTSNYPLTAAVYKLMEYNDKCDPGEYLDSKKMVLEHISGKKEDVLEEEVIQTFREQDRDIRKLGFKLIIEKFNEKYRTLNNRQKVLLQRFINEDVNGDEFKDYIYEEVNWLNKQLNFKKNALEDDILKIKINEVQNLTQNILSAKVLKEEHLSAMLKYYELLEEL